MAETFDRDFGYLMPFLEKIEKAAGELSDPAARNEATRLAAEEKQRWARMRALLGGEKAATTGATADVRAAAPRPPVAPAAGFTVGSLRGGGARRDRGPRS